MLTPRGSFRKLLCLHTKIVVQGSPCLQKDSQETRQEIKVQGATCLKLDKKKVEETRNYQYTAGFLKIIKLWYSKTFKKTCKSSNKTPGKQANKL